MDQSVLILSIVGSVATVVNQTLIRKKRWIGWAGAIPNVLLYMYVNWQAGAWGYTALGVFYLYNAVMGLREWRSGAV